MQMQLKASYQAMGFWLAAFSLVWLIGGVVGTVSFGYRGEFAYAAIAFLLAVLVVGLWRRWPWVKLPLLVYWSILAAAGILLVVLRGWNGIETLRWFTPLYFVYLITQWRPENWPKDSIVI